MDNPNFIVPTAPPGTATNQAASTAFVELAISSSASGDALNMAEFGIVGDAVFTQGTGYITATANGTTTLTTANTAGVTIGANIANLSWHSFAAAAIASAGVVPIGTTVVSFVPNVSITLSNPVVAASNLALMWWTESLTGTDNTAAMQACIDYALQNGYPDIQIPLGKYLISDTLQAGWGDGFYTIRLLGTDRFSFSGSLPGVTIYSTKTDRPCLNFQGMRAPSLKGISFIGRSQQFTDFAQGFSNLLSSDPLDWIDPRFVPSGNTSGGLQRHAPYVGVSQDAYAGTKPVSGGAYPDRTYPAWVIAKGYSTQYQGALSSDLLIEDVCIEGFGVQIAAGLNSDSQGDFLKMNRLLLSSMAYGVSIGNSQSRNVQFTNINAARYHTLFSGTNLGMQDGEIVGPINNVAGGNAYQFFDFSSLSISGPLLIENLYCENQVRIGNFVGGTSLGGEVIIRGGLIDLITVKNNLPASLITTGNFGQVAFEGTIVNYGLRIANIAMGGGLLTIKGGAWNCSGASPTTAAQLRAINYCGGFLAGDPRFNAVPRNLFTANRANMSYYPTVSGGITNNYHDTEITFLSSAGTIKRAPMTQAAREYVDQQNRRWRMTVPPEVFISITSPGYAADVMTFSYSDALQTNANVMYNLTPGDMLYHVESGTIFVVNSIGAPSGGFDLVTCTQQNNLQVDASNAYVANLNPIPSLAGETVIIRTGAVIPAILEYATFNTSNGNLASISDGTGTSQMANYYVNGDYFFGLTNPATAYRPWPIAAGSTLSAVSDGTPGTATLSKTGLFAGVFPLFPYEIY